MNNFSNNLKYLRTEKGISQNKLCKDIGYSNSIVSKWEAGEREPTASALIALAKYFNVSTDYLLGLEE